MKKYIIIMLSFLGLLFINVGIVSADDKISSKLTATQIEEINKRVQEAGLPIDHREELFSNYKNFTDYVIYIPRSEFYGDSREVKLVLYTRSKNDPDGWSGEEFLDTDVTEYMQYELKYDEDNKKWYWHTWGDYPSPNSMVGIDGYIINATETIAKNIDTEQTFFPQRSPLDLAWGVTKMEIQQKIFQLWQNLVPYGIILLASWVSWVILYKVLRPYLAV
jgi:hypothetical protein